MRIRVGAIADRSLPAGTLVEDERVELGRILAQRDELDAQIKALEARVQLLLLTARDRRGLCGQVLVDLASGTIIREGAPDAD